MMKKIVIILLINILPYILLSQVLTDTVYLDVRGYKSIPSESYFKKIYEYKDSVKNSGIESTYKKGVLFSRVGFSNIEKKIKDGYSIIYYDNGDIKKKEFYKSNQQHDTLITFYPNGQVKRIDIYEFDSLIFGKCYTSNGADTAYYNYIILPRYKGGEEDLQKFLKENIVYPKKAKRKGIQETVFVHVFVDKEGKISTAPPAPGRFRNKILIIEGIRVVNLLGDWNPGYIDGEPANFSLNIPIAFKLKY